MSPYKAGQILEASDGSMMTIKQISEHGLFLKGMGGGGGGGFFSKEYCRKHMKIVGVTGEIYRTDMGGGVILICGGGGSHKSGGSNPNHPDLKPKHVTIFDVILPFLFLLGLFSLLIFWPELLGGKGIIRDWLFK